MSAPNTFSKGAAELEETFATYPLLRAVNFHSTARVNIPKYERQLAHYSQFFRSVNEAELDEYLVTGQWHKAKLA